LIINRTTQIELYYSSARRGDTSFVSSRYFERAKLEGPGVPLGVRRLITSRLLPSGNLICQEDDAVPPPALDCVPGAPSSPLPCSLAILKRRDPGNPDRFLFLTRLLVHQNTIYGESRLLLNDPTSFSRFSERLTKRGWQLIDAGQWFTRVSSLPLQIGGNTGKHRTPQRGVLFHHTQGCNALLYTDRKLKHCFFLFHIIKFVSLKLMFLSKNRENSKKFMSTKILYILYLFLAINVKKDKFLKTFFNARYTILTC